MSNNRFVFEGLARVEAGLRDLPGQFNTEASRLALAAATGAAHDIRRGYPRTAESLAQAVTVRPIIRRRLPRARRSRSGTRWRGSSRVAPKTARYLTSTGKQHRTGAIKDDGTFIVPVIMRARVRYYQQLREMLRRAGLVVSG